MKSKKDKLNVLADIFQSENLDGSIVSLKLSLIRPSENQPRQDKDKSIEYLAESIQKEGLLQPIIVTKRDGGYEIIAGERRYRAIKSLGWTEAECKILDRDEKESYRLAVIENLQRENLSPYEEADALLEMKRIFGYTDVELAEIFNKSRSYLTEIRSISTLPKPILDQAKSAGIDTINLLIQLHQAYKKNKAAEFLDHCKTGTIRTVQNAKDFNSGKININHKLKRKVVDSSYSFLSNAKISYNRDNNSININLNTEKNKINQESLDKLILFIDKYLKKFVTK